MMRHTAVVVGRQALFFATLRLLVGGNDVAVPVRQLGGGVISDDTVPQLDGARFAVDRDVVGHRGQIGDASGGGDRSPGGALAKCLQIGRASCRERGCQNGKITVVAVDFQKQSATKPRPSQTSAT